MKLKRLMIVAMVFVVSIAFYGCNDSLTTTDFLNSYSRINDSISVTKTVTYATNNEIILVNTKELSREDREGSWWVTLKETTKQLNVLSLSDTNQYDQSVSERYYYKNQIGVLTGEEIVWRDGLLDELTDLWGTGQNSIIKQEYLSNLVINEKQKSFTAVIKEDYYNQVVGVTEISNADLTISLDENKKIKSFVINYEKDAKKVCVSLDISF